MSKAEAGTEQESAGAAAAARVETTAAPGSRLGRLRPVLGFLRPYRWQLALAGLALTLTASITLLLGQGLRILVDQGFASGSGQLLDQAILLLFGLICLLSLGTFVRFYMVSWVGERVCADLRCAVFDHVVGLDPGFFEDRSSGEIQSRITTDTTLLQTVVGSSVSIALRNLLLLIGGVIWLFILNPRLSSIALLCIPLVVIPILFFGRRVRRLSRHSQDRIADVGSYVNETLAGIKTVHAFNHQPQDRLRFGRHVRSAFEAAVRLIGQRAWLTTVVIMLVMAVISVMLWVGGHDVLAGRISPGELAAFVFYALMVAGAVGAISEVFGDLQRAAGATERLMELLATPSLIRAPEQPLNLPRCRGELLIEELRFAYPSRPQDPAIRDLNLKVEPGSTLALVGASGAGKSTLFDLLLRFYEPAAGRICIDGVDISRLDPAQLRSHVGMVAQHPAIFSGTVRDNLLYGAPGAGAGELQEAARAAYADEFIDGLPQGYDTELGEGGVRLSGGQRQRIAIARVLLCNPQILLLDEATSALDAHSEHVVQQALQRVMEGRTTLVIAHRLATVVGADSIAVLDHGKLVARGRHRELLVSCPLYRHWASLQFGEHGLAAGERPGVAVGAA